MASRKHLRTLLPAPSLAPELPEHLRRRTHFYDLPLELRQEIYGLALQSVNIYILPVDSRREPKPLGLRLVSRQVHDEVKITIQRQGRVTGDVTDFDFRGVQVWLRRAAMAASVAGTDVAVAKGINIIDRVAFADAEKRLARNNNLCIHFRFSGGQIINHKSLRDWLHDRADLCRPQPRWKILGVPPVKKVCTDLKKRCRRMSPGRKKKIMENILNELGVYLSAYERTLLTRHFVNYSGIAEGTDLGMK